MLYEENNYPQAELAERLRIAMDSMVPPLLSVQLAEKCGVTKQAVNDWRRTGRIAKRHLPTIARETSLPLEFFLEVERGQSKKTRGIWERLGALTTAILLSTTISIAPQQAEAEISHNQIGPDTHMLRLRRWLLRLGALTHTWMPA